MEMKLVILLGIVTMLTLAVVLLDGAKTNQRRRYSWAQRRLIRRRPKPTNAGSGVKPLASNSNRVQIPTWRGQQDFDDEEEAKDFWDFIYENGEISIKPYNGHNQTTTRPIRYQWF